MRVSPIRSILLRALILSEVNSFFLPLTALKPTQTILVTLPALPASMLENLLLLVSGRNGRATVVPVIVSSGSHVVSEILIAYSIPTIGIELLSSELSRPLLLGWVQICRDASSFTLLMSYDVDWNIACAL